MAPVKVAVPAPDLSSAPPPLMIPLISVLFGPAKVSWLPPLVTLPAMTRLFDKALKVALVEREKLFCSVCVSADSLRMPMDPKANASPLTV